MADTTAAAAAAAAVVMRATGSTRGGATALGADALGANPLLTPGVDTPQVLAAAAGKLGGADAPWIGRAGADAPLQRSGEVGADAPLVPRAKDP